MFFTKALKRAFCLLVIFLLYYIAIQPSLLRANPGEPVIDLKVDCSYTVEGTLSVEHHNDMANFLGRDTTALGNVHVRVSARKKLFGGVWGNWAPWGKVRTDSDGHFKLSRSKNCQERQFMVKVHFKDSDLEIRHGMATDKARKVSWYTVYKESSANDGNRDIHKELYDLTFSSSGNHSLSNREPWFHADIWTLYQAAIDTMNSYGSRLGFHNKVKVKYPHNKPNLDPYANPINKVIYLVKKSGWDTGKDIDTMLHELFHIWVYQHSIFEERMANYLAGHLKEGTHGKVDRTFVAFHEGLAEWGNLVLKKKIPSATNNIEKPLSREGMKSQEVRKFSDVEFVDWGWTNFFNLLHKQDVWKYNFGTSNDSLDKTETRKSLEPYQNCRVGQLDFEELLNTIDHRGETDIMAIAEMSWPGFTQLVIANNNGVDKQDIQAYRKMLDIDASYDEIKRAMCSEKLVKLPDRASKWYGTYSGRNDGRKAKLTIQPSSDKYYLDITYEDLDRGTNLTGQADARQIVDGRFKTLENLTLTGSSGKTKTIKRLFLHSDPNYISGYSEWSGNDYGMAFSKSGVNASAAPRDLMNTSKELEQWSEWIGSYEGRQDGRRAKLTITWDNLLWLHIKLEGLDRNQTFTGTVHRGDQESTPAHILTDIKLTGKNGGVKRIEQLALHTWNTNYITGHSQWHGNDYGNYYTRTPGTPDAGDGGGFSPGYEKYEEIRKAKKLEKAYEASHAVSKFKGVLEQTGTEECAMSSQNCSDENTFPLTESQLRNSNYGGQTKSCVNQLNRIFDLLGEAESNSELNSKLDGFQKKINQSPNGSQCNSMNSMQVLSGELENNSEYNLKGHLLNKETNNYMPGFWIRAKILQSQSDDIDLGNKITDEKGAFTFGYSNPSNAGDSLKVRLTIMTQAGEEVASRLAKVKINQSEPLKLQIRSPKTPTPGEDTNLESLKVGLPQDAINSLDNNSIKTLADVRSFGKVSALEDSEDDNSDGSSNNLIDIAIDIVKTVGTNFSDGYKGTSSAWSTYRFIGNTNSFEGETHFKKPTKMALRGFLTVIAQSEVESPEQFKQLALDGAAYGGLIGGMQETHQLKNDSELYKEKPDDNSKVTLTPKGGLSLPGVGSLGSLPSQTSATLSGQQSVLTYGGSLNFGSRNGLDFRLTGLYRKGSITTVLQNDQITETEIPETFTAFSADLMLRPFPRIIVQPYVVGGIGLRKISYEGTGSVSVDESWQSTVPLGIGADIQLGDNGLILGAEMVDYLSNLGGQSDMRHDAFLFGYIGIPL